MKFENIFLALAEANIVELGALVQVTFTLIGTFDTKFSDQVSIALWIDALAISGTLL